MTAQEFLTELLKWLGGGGVALLGLFLTRKKDKKQHEYTIINELQEENKRKDERLDKQDEKIQYLVDQMDEMRLSMFKIQSEKHRSEVKNVELKSENDRLSEENFKLNEKLINIEVEKEELLSSLESELKKVREDLNGRIDRLIKENEELRKQIIELRKQN